MGITEIAPTAALVPEESLDEYRARMARKRLYEQESMDGSPRHVFLQTPPVVEGGPVTVHGSILFQCGPVAEFGVNGSTIEEVIELLVDRLRGFQSGMYACRENALAITHLEEAAHWLQHRTRLRRAQGVEGTAARHNSEARRS